MTLVFVDACPNAIVKGNHIECLSPEASVTEPPLDDHPCDLIFHDLDEAFVDLDCMPLPLRAYTQGSFDHFCGIYAIINALRIAKQKLNQDLYVDWSKVFAAMIKHLDGQAMLGKVIFHGLTREEHQSCLRAAADYLKQRHDLSVIWTWPWLGRRSISTKRMVADLNRHLEEPGTSIILHFVHCEQTHWTTLETVSDEGLCLADSAKTAEINVSDLRFSGAKDGAIFSDYNLCQYGVLKITMSGGKTRD